MPNHYHLIVLVKAEDIGRKVMLPFGTSYTKAINKEQGRIGALFQGCFKGKHIAKDSYLLHLSRYIHRNPLDAGLVSVLINLKVSSYPDYVGQRKGTLPKPNIVLSQFTSVQEYAAFVEGKVEDLDAVKDLFLD